MDHYDVLGFLIITLNCNVTIVGKIWLIFMILLRLVVIVVAGAPVYQDERERFVCNTLQPGCANVCYDTFSPVSHLRFWLVQSVSVLLPSAVFGVYVLHRGAELAARMPFWPQGGSRDQAPGNLSPREAHSLEVPDFSAGYIAHLCLRTLAEAAFGALHYLLFGFSVPPRFSCARVPCSGAVDCYVSRPTEKSTLMLFLWALSALSMLLSAADLLCSLRRRTRVRPGGRGGESPESALRLRRWAQGTALKHRGARTGERGAHSTGGQSAASGRMGLPDEDESELSLVSDKLPQACAERGGVSRTAAPQGRRSEHPSFPRGSPARPAGAGSSMVLESRRSEWV
ncbi:gap junction delta-4 protein [Saccopteryx bilineata]|uniref:gap junction delta-4 protein n=1 Tax=Saccopteryx bilineata TaxID=59482 RepID=UPI00338DD575